jgi:hypothetical protein
VVSGSAVLEDEYASVMVLAGGPMTPDGPRVGLDEQ